MCSGCLSKTGLITPTSNQSPQRSEIWVNPNGMRVLILVLNTCVLVSGSYLSGWFGWGGKKVPQQEQPEQTLEVVPTFRSIKDYDFSNTYESDYSFESSDHKTVEEERLIPKLVEEEHTVLVKEPELIEFSDDEEGSLFGISAQDEGAEEDFKEEVKICTVLGGPSLHQPSYPGTNTF